MLSLSKNVLAPTQVELATDRILYREIRFIEVVPLETKLGPLGCRL
jgi:hypothetical protein